MAKRRTINMVKSQVIYKDYSKDAERTALISGENLAHMFGKIARWYTDISWVGHKHVVADITDFPALGTAASKDVPASGDAGNNEVVMGNDSRLTDARTPTSHTHSVSEITDFPTLGTAAGYDVSSSGDASNNEVVLGNDSRLTDARTPLSHTHTEADITNLGTYAGASIKGGAATSANKLNIGNSDIGNSTTPVYFDSETGLPIALSYTIEKSVPADAVFTDTTYSTMGPSGSSHAGGLVPDTPSTAGTSKYLREDGTWEVPPNSEYVHPSHTPYSSGLYKITVDTLGHVSAASAVTGADLPSHSHTVSDITNFPTLGTAAGYDVPATGDAGDDEVVLGNDSRLSDARTPLSHTHTEADISDLGTYAGSSTKGGAATSANKLNIGSSDIGSETKPVYFNATTGKPVACAYSLNASVPANAVFTDINVKQSPSTANESREVLFAGNTGNTETVGTTGKSNKLYFNPSTGALTAISFSGSVDASNLTGSIDAGRLPNSGVTANSYGPAAGGALTYGGTFDVPYVTVDKYGRLTAASTKTFTMPAQYAHPTYTSKTSGLYKITVDSLGHVSATAAVTGADLPSHSHTLNMATSTGSSSITLAANTKYQLTAGGSTYIFTTPADTVYTHPTYTEKTNGLYKITVDELGHVSATAAVTASDLPSHTHPYLPDTTKYAGSSSVGGAATSANKLNIGSSNIGNSTTPVYFNSTTGLPVALNYTIEKSVPADAKFTDTVYTHPTYTAKASGLYKITVDELGHVSAASAVTGTDLPSHSHNLSMASSTGTSQISLSANTKYQLTAGGSTYIFTTPVDNNTTYTVATGDSNGQIKITPSVGDAYNVSVKGLGSAAYTNSSAYATSGHTHTLNMATDTGTSQISLSANTKYKLTAGGSTYIFTTPSDTNTTYSVTSGDNNGQIKITPSSGDAYNVSVKGLGSAAYTNSSAYATSGHTHTLNIAASSGTSQISLSPNTKYQLTAGGSTYIFTTPPATTMTYSISTGDNNGQIKVTPSSGDAYNVSVKGLGSAAYTNSSAYAAASHTHSQYLPLAGGTMTGAITLVLDKYNVNEYGLDCNNSNIIGVNNIKFKDSPDDDASEGIHFYRTDSTWDSLWGKNGALYFTPNHPTDTTTYTIYHSGNLTYSTIGAAAANHTHSNYLPTTTKYALSDSVGGPAISAYSGHMKFDNEFNFSKLAGSGHMWFGYRWDTDGTTEYGSDVDIYITRYKFGNASAGLAEVEASAFIGNASSASKLNTNAGSNVSPVYFSGGVPVACKQVASGAYFSTVPYVRSDGVMDIGRYLDFHTSNTSTSLGYRIDQWTTDCIEFYSPGTNNRVNIFTAGNGYAQLSFQLNAPNKAYTATGIVVNPLTTTGTVMRIESGGNMIVGAGESPSTLYSNDYDSCASSEQERLYLAADGDIVFVTNTDTYANRKEVILDADGNFRIGPSQYIIQTQNSTSNYTDLVQWWKGGTNPGNYGPSIGHHNTGDTDGAIILLPYHTSSTPWSCEVGLYISKTRLWYNGTAVSLNGHTHNYIPNTDVGLSAAINLLSIGDSDPVDDDYYVSQIAGGGTTSTSYHRRPVSKLWNYIKGKITSSTSGSGNAVTAVSYSGGAITVTKGSTFSVSTHTHGLLNSNLCVNAPNETTNTWAVIGANGTGHVLKSIRTQANAAPYLLGNYSAGIVFGGADTRGVISHSYGSPSVRFAGGNKTATDGGTAVWYFTVNATSGQTYTLPSTGGTLALSSHTHSNYLGAISANSYWGMASPSGATNDWIRTTSVGIIPYQSGGAGSGHCGLGTSSWYFSYAYIDSIYGTLYGRATEADNCSCYYFGTDSYTTNVSYAILFAADPTISEVNSLRKTDDIRVNYFLGAANTEGLVELVLGNNTVKSSANNASGHLTLYNANGKYAEIFPGSNSANINLTLPSSAGTFALVGDNNHTHSYIPLSGSTAITGELVTTSANGYRLVYNKYGAIIRNDGESWWFLITSQQSSEAAAKTASWANTNTLVNNSHPLRIQLSNGRVYINGYTIDKSVPSDAKFTDTNTTYTIGTGASNGQIKVTPSSGSAYNVSVKGLGSAAYTNSSAYAAASHTHSSITGPNKHDAAVPTSTVGDGVLTLFYNVDNSSGNMPKTNNANAILQINKHSGEYDSQLGFSSDGNIYYRSAIGSAFTTSSPWKQLAWKDDRLGANSDGSYWGMSAPNNDASVWIRTTSLGIIPYQSGNLTSGHQYLGTSSWYFSQAYVDNYHGHYLGLGSSSALGIIELQGPCSESVAYGSSNPHIRFYNNDASQNIDITFCDYDSVRAPAALSVHGNQGGEYLLAPNIAAWDYTNNKYMAVLSAWSLGTTSAVGQGRVIAGNGTKKGTAGNARGLIEIYSEQDGAAFIIAPPSLTTDVTVTLPSTNGTMTEVVYKTVKTASSVTHSGWTSVEADSKIVPNMSFIAYWNGAYDSSNHSNLSYCARGALGSIVTHAEEDYLLKTGGTLTGNLKITETKNLILRTTGDDRYIAGIGYDTSGNECIALWAKNTVTRLRWYAGTDMSNMAVGSMMGITPDFEISKASGTALGYIGGRQIVRSQLLFSGSTTITSGKEKTTITLTDTVSPFGFVAIRFYYSGNPAGYCETIVSSYNNNWMSGVFAVNPGGGAPGTYNACKTIGVYVNNSAQMSFNCDANLIIYNVTGYCEG